VNGKQELIDAILTRYDLPIGGTLHTEHAEKFDDVGSWEVPYTIQCGGMNATEWIEVELNEYRQLTN